MRWVFAVILIATSVAHANMGKPEQPAGGPAGEPRGIGAIAIESEQLAIDLRPLADDKPARVSATYRLVSAAEEQQLTLVFATGAETVYGFTVTIDGKEIRSTPQDIAASGLPAEWLPPKDGPELAGETWAYELAGYGGLGFPLVVPPGSHVVTVTYGAEPMRVVRPRESPTVIYRLAYVLAPARSWGDFRGLDATIVVPDGWRVTVVPELQRTGNTLHARFAKLPGDAFAIVATAATSWLYRAIHLVAPLLALVALIGGGVATWRHGVRRARRGKLRSGGALAGFAWAVVLLATCLLWIDGGSFTIPASQLAKRGYGPGIAAIGAMLLALIVWPAGAMLARAAWKRNDAVRPPRP